MKKLKNRDHESFDGEDYDAYTNYLNELLDKVPYSYDKDVDRKDTTLQGAIIMSKYTNYIFAGADHDVIYGPEIDELTKAGITEEDFIAIGTLGWGLGEDDMYLQHFV